MIHWGSSTTPIRLGRRGKAENSLEATTAFLFHGTTLWRARQILTNGPSADFIEPGGTTPAENFSACLPFGPFACTDRPETYALRKANAASLEGRDEGGPALLLTDVPDPIIALAVDEFFPLSQGFVQFDLGSGLESLQSAWPNLAKRIIPFTDTEP